MGVGFISSQALSFSGGMLSKDEQLIDGVSVLVKGNYGKGTLEPYSEVIASNIADILKIIHVNYWLARAEEFPEISATGIEHVCLCEKLGSKLVNFADYLESCKVVSKKANKIEFLIAIKELKLATVNFRKMMVFDALIGNKDRHLNNWDFMVHDSGGVFLAPVLDNGQSLLFDVPENKLKIYTGNEIGPDLSKPWKDTHTEQIKFLRKHLGLDRLFIGLGDSDWFIKEVDLRCSSVFSCLTDRRVESVRYYLKQRYKRFIEPIIT